MGDMICQNATDKSAIVGDEFGRQIFHADVGIVLRQVISRQAEGTNPQTVHKIEFAAQTNYKYADVIEEAE